VLHMLSLADKLLTLPVGGKPQRVAGEQCNGKSAERTHFMPPRGLSTGTEL
jgi:hypothetical protein